MRRDHGKVDTDYLFMFVVCSVVFVVAAAVILTGRDATYMSPEQRAERSLGSGAVCAEEDDGVTVCVFQGDEYRCVRRRNVVACARRQ